MKLTAQELTSLQRRCLRASSMGHKIALASEYVKTLSAEAGVSTYKDIEVNSAMHIYKLVTDVLAIRSGVKVLPEMPKPVYEAPKAEVTPEPEALPETEVAVEEVLETSPEPKKSKKFKKYSDS